MKSIIFTIIFAIGVNAILAQTWMMNIKQGNSTTYSGTTTVDEITFIKTTTLPFICGDVILYGGEEYPTVKIGSQCWFQKNLNIGIRIASSSNQEDNSTIEKYCYNDYDSTCTTYGGLYQWDETMQYSTTPGVQGICPEGWHIPTAAEFETLQIAVSNDGNSLHSDGNALKAIGQGTGEGVGTNTSGFSAILAGYGHSGHFGNLDLMAFFWSSNDGGDPSGALYLGLGKLSILYGNEKEDGFSVRCLKD